MLSSTANEPLISVVMPVYNAGSYLVDAIASIIEQSLGDWELICVNDGSTDGSGQLLDWFATQDSRIRAVHQTNSGIVAALNRGCELARAPLIARMDGDDIAIPDRFEKQVAFFRRAPQCVAVGGAILEIDTEGDSLSRSDLPGGAAKIVERLLTRRTGLFHPTVMMRTEALCAVGGYRQRFQWIEDHDLWLRLAQRGQLANLPDTLLCYRQHPTSVCWQRSGQQRGLMNELLQEAYSVRNLELPPHLLLTSSVARSPAGPGKWARAAAKGGYPRSVVKHLKQLRRSASSSPGYVSRMTVESLLRLTVGYPRRLWAAEHLRVPSFQPWHARVAAEKNKVESSHKRAA